MTSSGCAEEPSLSNVSNGPAQGTGWDSLNFSFPSQDLSPIFQRLLTEEKNLNGNEISNDRVISYPPIKEGFFALACNNDFFQIFSD